MYLVHRHHDFGFALFCLIDWIGDACRLRLLVGSIELRWYLTDRVDSVERSTQSEVLSTQSEVLSTQSEVLSTQSELHSA